MGEQCEFSLFILTVTILILSIKSQMYLYSMICDFNTLSKSKLFQASPFHGHQPLKQQDAVSQKWFTAPTFLRLTVMWSRSVHSSCTSSPMLHPLRSRVRMELPDIHSRHALVSFSQ